MLATTLDWFTDNSRFRDSRIQDLRGREVWNQQAGESELEDASKQGNKMLEEGTRRI